VLGHWDRYCFENWLNCCQYRMMMVMMMIIITTTTLTFITEASIPAESKRGHGIDLASIVFTSKVKIK
jgi:hypothetical protein